MIRQRAGGFTLIEVVGALVVFSVGVLMAISITTGLSGRFHASSVRTAVSVMGQERLDSLGALPYDSVAVGTTVDSVTVRSESYTCTVTVTQPDPVTRQIAVTLNPSDGTGPQFAGTAYVGRVW